MNRLTQLDIQVIGSHKDIKDDFVINIEIATVPFRQCNVTGRLELVLKIIEEWFDVIFVMFAPVQDSFQGFRMDIG